MSPVGISLQHRSEDVLKSTGLHAQQLNASQQVESSAGAVAVKSDVEPHGDVVAHQEADQLGQLCRG